MRVISRETAIKEIIVKFFKGETGQRIKKEYGEIYSMELTPSALELLQKIDPNIKKFEWQIHNMFLIFYEDKHSRNFLYNDEDQSVKEIK